MNESHYREPQTTADSHTCNQFRSNIDLRNEDIIEILRFVEGASRTVYFLQRFGSSE